MTLLRIDASIQGGRSASSELADVVLAEWSAERPDEPVVRRHLGKDPLPADAWATAVGAAYTPADQLTEAQAAARALAGELAAELRAADAVVLALPLYNFGVSQHAKVWIDLAVAGGSQGERLLDGTPTVLLTTRGGAYGAGTPREGWDHSTPYLRRVFEDVLKLDLRVAEAELTLAEVNPAMEALRGLATESLRQAHIVAEEHGRKVAQLVRAAA
jgi:FMN-dependent NADH-azoreductase